MEESERLEYEADAREHGIPLMLDRMGLDGLGNEVVALHKRIIVLEAELTALKERRCETCTHWHTDYDFTCPIYALDGYWYGANFCCIRWTEKEIK